MAVTPEQLIKIVKPYFDNINTQLNDFKKFFERELEHLFNQSEDQYNKITALEKSLTVKIDTVEKELQSSIAGQGARIGETEKSIKVNEKAAETLAGILEKKENSKRFSISQAIVIGAVILDIGYRIFTGG